MNQDWVNDWYLLGTTTDVAEGTVDQRTVGRLNLAVFCARGEYFAVRDVCAHCSHSLAGGVVVDGAVQCPQCGHESRFSHDPGISADGDGDRLSTFPVMVVDEELFAWIEALA